MPSNRPTTHENRTAISVRLGPNRSTRNPQPKLARIATTVSRIEVMSHWPWVSPTAFTATTLITTISVLTASL